MRAPGYLFLFGGALLVRQVAIGRAQETPQDIRDLSVALLNGDSSSISSVLSRRGTNVDAPAPGEVATGPVAGASTSLTAEVMKLGNAANGYRLGATGPDYYDCSGLIWRACKNLDLYSGPRFTTHTFQAISRGWAHTVESPVPGNIILWTGKHMGIALGGDRMYSARSTKKGIGESTISGDSGYFGREPSYWAVTGDA